MRKSIRRTSHRKKAVSDKYSRKSRRTKTARNKNRSRNHKKSRKQMYVGGGCGASSAAGGVYSKEVTDWWYQSEERDGDGYYTWTQMGPRETEKMNVEYYNWTHYPASERVYLGFNMNILSSDGKPPSYNVKIYFPAMEMTNNTTTLTKKITFTTRCEDDPVPVPPTIRVNTPPFIKPVIPSKDAFGQPQPAPSASSPLTSAKWFWESDDGGEWKAFTPEDSNFLENAYTNREKIAKHNTRPWEFHFDTPMYQQNTNEGGTARSIMRRV